MIERRHLANRRAAEVFDFMHAHRKWTATVGRFRDGSVAEVFLDTKPSPLADMAADAAILASICLQSGANFETVRHAIAGRAGPLAAALALIEPKDEDQAGEQRQ